MEDEASNYQQRKVGRKQRRVEAMIQKEYGVESSVIPTTFLAVLNAGHSTGLTEEQVIFESSKYGQVNRLIFLANKSYCFVECATLVDAEKIFTGMHNKAKICQKDTVAYLSYVKALPNPKNEIWREQLPNGLFVIPDFVSAMEENDLLLAVNAEGIQTEGSELKHRKVKHFGYEFMYDTNNVDPNRPLQQSIPITCAKLWPRFQKISAELKISLEWQSPDQLTVNEYAPGQGIPPHVDTHSAFLDPIISLSLEDDVVMEFRRGIDRVSVNVPRRSLLIMSGESRYAWTHGITPRCTDIMLGQSGALTTRKRHQRTSLTFRRLRRAPCTCEFPLLCDSRQQKGSNDYSNALETNALNVEATNVHAVYDKIATHFSETRHTPWPQVASFLQSFEPGAVLLDIGCGNGKYLDVNQNILAIGCDRSHQLLSTCATRGNDVFRCDCLNVPVRSQSLDGCISIAVIHHLATPERRLAAVREMARLLRPGGHALIYVWAKNQHKDASKSSYLRQNKAINKQKTTEEEQRCAAMQELQLSAQLETPVRLPIHTNRTDFQQQDVLVPWKLKKPGECVEEQSTFLRYYHVFDEHELSQMVAQVEIVDLVTSYYDQGNHCVIFKRK